MTNITINAKNRTIVITKAFEKEASKFGSEAYNALKEAKADNAGFRVVVKSTKQKRETNKGLTYEYMEKFIAAHDDENKTIMAEYRMLRGMDEEFMAESLSYAEMKDWFFSTFPEIAEFHKKREAIMKRVNANKAA